MYKKGEKKMNLSEKQLQALETLSKPYPFNNHHPIDAFDGRTIHSLEKRKLVKFYHTTTFLRGAVRLTEEGIKVLEQNLKIAM